MTRIGGWDAGVRAVPKAWPRDSIHHFPDDNGRIARIAAKRVRWSMEGGRTG